MRLIEQQILSVVNPVAPVNSSEFDLGELKIYSLHIINPGGVTLSFKLQVSDDVYNPTPSSRRYVDYTGTVQTTITTDFIYIQTNEPYRYVRLAITAASGASGTVTAVIVAKE